MYSFNDIILPTFPTLFLATSPLFHWVFFTSSWKFQAYFQLWVFSLAALSACKSLCFDHFMATFNSSFSSNLTFLVGLSKMQFLLLANLCFVFPFVLNYFFIALVIIWYYVIRLLAYHLSPILRHSFMRALMFSLLCRYY